MFRLAEHYLVASKRLEKLSRTSEWGASAPFVLIDSFAVELLLKCLYVMDTCTSPPGIHDFEELYEGLLPKTRLAIWQEFESMVKADPVLRNLHVINPEAVMVTDFQRSLKAAKGSFDRRRYLYEEEPDQEWFYAHLLRESILAVTRKRDALQS